MVADSRRDDRGQLLLVGGISIALVIVGGVVLLNGMMFTNTIGSHGNQDAVSEAERTIGTMESDLQDLTSRVRADVSPENFESALRENITAYTRQYTNLNYDNGIVYVDATLNETLTDDSLVVSQNASAGPPTVPTGGGSDVPSFEDNTGTDDWDLARNASEVRRFNVTLQKYPGINPGGATNTDAEFTVLVSENESSDFWAVRFNQTGGGVRQLTIWNSSGRQRTITEGSVLPPTGDVPVDIRGGTVNGNDVPQLVFTDELDAPYDVRYENAGPNAFRGGGTYRLATNSSYQPGTESDTHPNVADSLDSVAVNLTYQRPELRYERTVRLNGTG